MSYPKTAAVAAALMTGLLPAASAQADVSATIGYVSEYIYRGLPQKNSSASAGIEYGESGFAVGAWGADVGDGMEVDVYGSYGGEVDAFSWSVGATGYYYTGNFDDTYQELNLSGGYGIASVALAFGQYDNFSGPTQDYTFYSLTLEAPFGGYATFGGFSQDFDGEYLELGYASSITDDVELSLALIFSNDDLLGGSGDENIVVGITKSFSWE